MVAEPLEYQWSSYNSYLDDDCDKIIDDEKILSYFKNKSRNLYMNYVESIDINLVIDKKIKEKMEDDQMASIVNSFAISGIEGYRVEIETDTI